MNVGGGSIRRLQQLQQIRDTEVAPTLQMQIRGTEAAPTLQTQIRGTEAAPTLQMQIRGTEAAPTLQMQIRGTEAAPTLQMQIAAWRPLPHYEYQTPQNLIQSLFASFAGLSPATAYAASPDGNGAAENGWVEADDIFGEAADTDSTQLLSDLGSELGVDRYSEFTLPWIMSVVSRNVAMQLATSDAQANAEILKAVEAIHVTLGIELNKAAPDRNKGWKNTFFVRQMLDEDIAVNPDHFMLFAVCLVLMLVSGRVRGIRHLRTVTLCIIIGFVLLSIWFGWSPYNSRRFLPLFVISAPVIAVTLCAFIRIPYVVELLAAALLWFAYPWVVGNTTRPLVGARTIFNTPRYDQYFIKFEQLRTPYKAIAAFLQTNKIASVGFFSDTPFVDYPLVVALQADPQSQLRFKHIGVNNLTRNIKPRFDDPDPEIIVSWDPAVTGMQTKVTSYSAIWSDGNVAVLAAISSDSREPKGDSRQINIEHSTLNIEHRTSKTEDRGPRTEDGAESKAKSSKFKVALDAENEVISNQLSVISDSKLQTENPRRGGTPSSRKLKTAAHLKLSTQKSALDSLAESMQNCFAEVDAQMLQNGRFLDGMANWQYWQYGVAHTNNIMVQDNIVRIENPSAQLIGIQQRIAVVSGAVYRLSGVARSVATTQSDIIFGGRVAFFMPPQKERQLVWTSEYNEWSQREMVFTNAVTGTATILVHMGYGRVASTGEFANIRLEQVP